MKPIVKFVSLLALSAALAACNTLDGFGKDLTVAGTALSGAVSKDDKKAVPASTQPAPVYQQSNTPAPAPQRR